MARKSRRFAEKLPTIDWCLLNQTDLLMDMLKRNQGLSQIERATVDGELQILQDRLDCYCDLVLRVEESVRLRAALLAPVRAMPPEILSMIFVEASEASEGYPEDIFYRHSIVRIISQVCSRWRGIALSTSALWSNIEINFKRIHRILLRHGIDVGVKMIMSTTEIWTERAGQASVDIAFNGLTEYPMPEMPPKFFNMFFSYASNWRSLQLSDFNASLLSLLFCDPLVLANVHTLVLESITSDLPIPIGTPSLRVLDLRDTETIRRSRILDSLPWGQLSSLRMALRPTSLASGLAAIRAASCNLEELALNSYEGIMSLDAESVDSIVFPSLRRLELAAWYTPLIDIITAPSLQDLRVTPHYSCDAGWKSLINLVHRSRCHVHSLTIKICTPLMNGNKLADIFSAFSGTTHLTLLCDGVQTKWRCALDLLKRHPKNDQLLPALKHVEFRECRPSQPLYKAIIAVVNSRLNEMSGASISALTVHSKNKLPNPKSLLRAMERWRKFGVVSNVFNNCF